MGRRQMFPKEPLRISSTWGEGNAISSAIGYRTIEIIQEENLLENARQKGAYFLAGLGGLQQSYPAIFDPRGLGLMLAFSVETEEWRNQILSRAFQKGLLLIGCGFESIRILPPLNVKKREIELALEILDQVLSEVIT